MDRPEDRLALIECHERDGRIGRVFDVQAWPVSIGRALDNHVVIDDPHVALHHARLQATADDAVTLAVLNTDNGVVVQGRRLRSGASVTLPVGGTTLQLGGVSLRVRLPGEVLAPERALPALAPGRTLRPALAAAMLMLLALAEHALALDPGAEATAWLPLLVGLPGVVAAWCGMWALMSKLFQHRFDFAAHLRIALPGLLALELVDVVLPQLGGILGWPALWRLAAPLQVVVAAMLLRAHLVHLLPLHRRSVTAAVVAMVLTGSAISLTVIHQSTDSYSRSPYMSTLPLPALHWARTVPPAALVEEMAPLAQQLAERVKKAQQEEAAEEAEAGAGD